ncbi:MAG: TetR/AcrR family transcriptional regulator [Planctomycetes bacterium]|nr:TetR/AcrR family transcriptional regulator [Planctomycetota bacterium]
MSRSRSQTPKGQRTREAILQAATEIASTEGLEAVSFGRVAQALGVSKSGLFSHFPTKEALQLALLDRFRTFFVETVVEPSDATPEGLPRLWGLCSSWLRYAETTVSDGGCLFQRVASEYASRPGPIQDLIKELTQVFNGRLQRRIHMALEAGHLKPEVQPLQLAFELQSLMGSANGAFQLFGHPGVFELCRRGLASRLESVMTPEAPPLEGL